MSLLINLQALAARGRIPAVLLPGMANHHPGSTRYHVGDGPEFFGEPDLTDPATRGCVLEQIRTASGDPHASCFFSETIGAWLVKVKGRDPVESYVSEGDALERAVSLLARERCW